MPKKEIYLILDNIRSRENVGSIFRTADAAGVSKIYLCGITPTPPHEKISKTALGAEMYVPWEYCKRAADILKKLKKQKIKIVALEQTPKSVDIFEYRPKFPLALVLGNEVKGLSPQILKYCDKKISIPMYGKKESLNVSVATGVALYIIKEHGS
ncbi:MAG: RNA methyltransferase [Candidatus Yanofskybacteria bacterium]|nr:RNA methyltransferase [Candidatus Yanofskybacteria bacterium]